MVEMGVCEQHVVKPPEAGAAAEKLALGAFPAVDQNSLAAGLDEQGRVAALC